MKDDLTQRKKHAVSKEGNKKNVVHHSLVFPCIKKHG